MCRERVLYAVSVSRYLHMAKGGGYAIPQISDKSSRVYWQKQRCIRRNYMPRYTATFDDQVGSTVSVDVDARDIEDAKKIAAAYAVQFDQTVILGQVLEVIELPVH